MRGRDLSGVVGKDVTAPTLASVLKTSKGEALSLASRQADRRSHGAVREVHLPGERAATGRAIRVATQGLVVGNGVDASVEGGISPDREQVVAATRLRAVPRAGECALRVVDLGAVDGTATVADTIVLKTSIAETVAWGLD